MLRSRLVIAFGAALALAPAGAALAQEAPPAEGDNVAKKEDARAHFDKGITLFEEGAWDPALVEFTRSRELHPTRAATKNAALCLRKLGRYDEALVMFEALLREFPNLPPEDKAIAERETQELASRVGYIEIRGAEPGASVTVDGRARGTVPAAPIRVPVGTHRVRVVKEGFVPFEGQVEVAGVQVSSVVAKLAALTQGGRLRVTERSGAAADVLVDGAVVGKTPWEGTVAPGDHTVLLRGERDLGTQPAQAPVRLNQLTPITLALEQLDATLRVEPTPRDATVALDGVSVGRGVWEGRLRAGAHRVEIASEGFLPDTQKVAIATQQRSVVTVTLERDPASAQWRAANPPRFFVEADGAIALVPSFGGNLASACSDPCSKGLGLGGLAVGRAGYQLGSGLGFGLEGGFLSVSESLEGRSTALTPTGLAPNQATADDSLRLSGLVVGASGQFHRGQRATFLGRIGVGALLGTLRDDRKGSATTNERTVNPGTPQERHLLPTPYTFDATESPAARYFYVAPELRLGVRFGGLVVSAGVEALVLVALTQPKWADENPVFGPDIGQAKFGEQALAGKAILILSPGLGVRYEL